MRSENEIEKLLDALVLKAGQAQVVRMFKNSAQDGVAKLIQLDQEILDIKSLILKETK
jgi:hypothetical protein